MSLLRRSARQSYQPGHDGDTADATGLTLTAWARKMPIGTTMAALAV